MNSPEVIVYEVGPRDGLQNEPDTLATETKLELITRLVRAGLSRVEVTSFVSPKWIPQLADADAVAAGLPEADAQFSALVPNEAGYERFMAARLPVAAFFVSASETHNKKNVNRGVAEHLERFRPVAERAGQDDVRLRAYVSTVCGCPYEGEVATAAVVKLSKDLVALGVEEISLGDTIGVGVPAQVRKLVRAVAGEVGLERIALHMHDTYGRALANVSVGYEEGVRIFDASLGGLGGCPYAPGASGNVATEDVVDLFERSGVDTGIDLGKLVETTAWLERDILDRPLPGRVYRAVSGGSS